MPTKRMKASATQVPAIPIAGKTYDTRAAFQDLFPSTFNYRQKIDPDYIQELAASLLIQGVLQNLLARPASDRRYEVFAGGCRYLAIKSLVDSGQWNPEEPNIPLQVREGISDADLVVAGLVENGKRRETHWLEEADGIANAVRLLTDGQGPSRGDGVTALLAEQLGTTQRWIQILLSLSRDLHPEIKEIFLANPSLPIDLAKTIRTVPLDRQPMAIDPLNRSIAGGYSLHSAGLKEFLLAGLPRVEDAIFEVSDYQGSILQDDDSDNEEAFSTPLEDDPFDDRVNPKVFLDADQFAALQKEAIERRRAELLVHHHFVEVIHTDQPWLALNDYQRHPGHPEAGAVMLIAPDLSVSVETDLIPRPKLVNESQPKVIDPLTKAHLYSAHRLKSAALQRALIGSLPDTMRVAILGLLGYSPLFRIELGQPSPDDRVLDPALKPALDLMKATFGSLVDLPEGLEEGSLAPQPVASYPRFNFFPHDPGDAPRKALEALWALSDQEVAILFTAAVACRTGSFCDYAPSSGDRDIVATLASITGASAANAFIERGGIDEAFLRGYRKPQLIRVSKACGVQCEKPEELTSSDLRGLILRSEGRSSFVPPELEFGSAQDIQQRLDLVGSPKSPAKGKPKKPSLAK